MFSDAGSASILPNLIAASLSIYTSCHLQAVTTRGRGVMDAIRWHNRNHVLSLWPRKVVMTPSCWFLHHSHRFNQQHSFTACTAITALKSAIMIAILFSLITIITAIIIIIILVPNVQYYSTPSPTPPPFPGPPAILPPLPLLSTICLFSTVYCTHTYLCTYM